MDHRARTRLLGSQLSPFEHAPLDSPSEEIRLLRIHPAKESSEEPINCTLTHHTLISSSIPSYFALSYAWGQPSSSDPSQPVISINSCTFTVGPNLHVALQHLRSRTEARVFWIDAICIDQKDNEEKSKQVELMKDIYARAEGVVIWLGPASGNGNKSTDTAMQWIDRLGGELVAKGIEKLTYGELQKWQRDDEIVPSTAEGAENEHEISQVKQDLEVYMTAFLQWIHNGKDPLFWRHSDLGKRPWFERGWCQQECANGRHVVIQCGQSIVGFTHFWATAYFLNIFVSWAINRYRTADEIVDQRTREILDACTEILPGQTIGIRRVRLSTPNSKRLGLKALLTRINAIRTDGSRTQVTYPIDRVYALLGIANDEAAKEIVPAYGPPGKEVEACAAAYIETAKALLRHGNLDILGFCRRRAIERSDLLPSWAPDWEGANLAPWTGLQEDELFNASGSISPSITFSEAGTGPPLMFIDGIRVDSIEAAGHAWTVDLNKEQLANNRETMSRVLADVAEFVQQSPRYTLQEKQEGVWRIPISDLEQSGVVNWPRRATESARNGWKVLSTLCEGDHEFYAAHPEHNIAHQSYIGRFRRMQNARPWRGSDGYVGMCPEQAKPDDVVVVFLGAKVPYVLRRLEDVRQDRWRLVGECFAYGAMDGEVLRDRGSVERFAVQ